MTVRAGSYGEEHVLMNTRVQGVTKPGKRMGRPKRAAPTFGVIMLLEELASFLHYDAFVVLAHALALQIIEDSGG